MDENINPIKIIRNSRFNHYLIENEFTLQMKIYESMFQTLKNISESIDKYDRVYKKNRRFELYGKIAVVLSIIIILFQITYSIY